MKLDTGLRSRESLFHQQFAHHPDRGFPIHNSAPKRRRIELFRWKSSSLALFWVEARGYNDWRFGETKAFCHFNNSAVRNYFFIISYLASKRLFCDKQWAVTQSAPAASAVHRYINNQPNSTENNLEGEIIWMGRDKVVWSGGLESVWIFQLKTV